MSISRLPTLMVALTLLAGCATVPQPLQGTYAAVSTTTVQRTAANSILVRWGGRIIKTASDAQQTCFYLLSRPLDNQARPRPGLVNSDDQDRFVTCHRGSYDPTIYAQGRELTIIGTPHGKVAMQEVGEDDRGYPLVDANVVYLWPKRSNAAFPPDVSGLMGNPQYPPEEDRQPTGMVQPTVR